MKIQEIQLYKDLQTIDYSRDMADVIKGHGWDILGWGYEGVVAKHPTKPLALKLFLSVSKYTNFVNLARRNPKNPHFPIFYKYVKTLKGTPWSYVISEMLTPVTEADLRTTFFSEICYLYIAAHGQNKTISDTIMDVLNSVWGTTDLESEVDQDSLIDEANKSDDKWKEAIDLVIGEAEHVLGISHIDLHEENLMRRNNQLVIIDPFFN